MVFMYSVAYVAMYLGDWKNILILFIPLLFHKHNTVEKLRLISIYALDLWAAYGLHYQRLLNPRNLFINNFLVVSGAPGQ